LGTEAFAATESKRYEIDALDPSPMKLPAIET